MYKNSMSKKESFIINGIIMVFAVVSFIANMIIASKSASLLASSPGRDYSLWISSFGYHLLTSLTSLKLIAVGMLIISKKEFKAILISSIVLGLPVLIFPQFPGLFSSIIHDKVNWIGLIVNVLPVLIYATVRLIRNLTKKEFKLEAQSE